MADMPLLDALGTAGQGYVAAAYLVFVLILIIYVSVMAMRLSRMARDVSLIDEMLQARDEHAVKAAASGTAAAESTSEGPDA